MTAEIWIAVVLLAGLIGYGIVSSIRDKKQGKMTCRGCPNYNSCRAHIGCYNNPNNRKK